MSHKLAGFAGFLVVAALATPQLGRALAPAAHADPDVSVVAVRQGPPVIVAAAPLVASQPVAVAPVEAIAVSSSSVAYGDAKTAGFDPDHPPADMGEPG